MKNQSLDTDCTKAHKHEREHSCNTSSTLEVKGWRIKGWKARVGIYHLVEYLLVCTET